MIDRFSTGDPRLDAVLGGGLIVNSITLISGAPGSGKTLLAEKCLFTNATSERPGLYLSTVSEPLDKLLRYGQSLSFFDLGQVGQSVIYEGLGPILDDDGLPGVLERIDALIKEHHPGLLVIDSFKAIRPFAATESDFRRFLHDLAGRLTAVAISSLWVGEYTVDDAVSSPEFAVADAVLDLAIKHYGERSIRYLTVLKLRGSGFTSGEHAYRLTSDGLITYPRLADPFDESSYETGTQRLSTGIPALDEALADGYWPGSATLIAGPSGAGKTTMGLHFLFAGATRAEPGILLTLQESRTQLAHVLEGFGWAITDPMLTVMDRSPVDLLIDELVYELLDRVRETKSRRVVIDSLNDLMITAPDELRFREFNYSLVRRLARAGVSSMFLLELPDLFRVTRLSNLGVSHASDNVILLQHVPEGPTMKRALTVLKTRGSSHESRIREFRITTQGLILGEPLEPQPPIIDSTR
jgi:circadian clock protein KaiC